MSSLDRALDEPALVFTVWRWELDIYLKTFSFLHANDVRQTHCDKSAIHHGSRISWICVTDSGPGTHAAPRTRPASPPRPCRGAPGPTRDRHGSLATHQTDWFRSAPRWSGARTSPARRIIVHWDRGGRRICRRRSAHSTVSSYNIDGIRLRACATPSGSGAGEGVRGGRASWPMSTGSVILCTGCQCTSMQLGEQPHLAC